MKKAYLMKLQTSFSILLSAIVTLNSPVIANKLSIDETLPLCSGEASYNEFSGGSISAEGSEFLVVISIGNLDSEYIEYEYEGQSYSGYVPPIENVRIYVANNLYYESKKENNFSSYVEKPYPQSEVAVTFYDSTTKSNYTEMKTMAGLVLCAAFNGSINQDNLDDFGDVSKQSVYGYDEAVAHFEASAKRTLPQTSRDYSQDQLKELSKLLGTIEFISTQTHEADHYRKMREHPLTVYTSHPYAKEILHLLEGSAEYAVYLKLESIASQSSDIRESMHALARLLNEPQHQNRSLPEQIRYPNLNSSGLYLGKNKDGSIKLDSTTYQHVFKTHKSAPNRAEKRFKEIYDKLVMHYINFSILKFYSGNTMANQVKYARSDYTIQFNVKYIPVAYYKQEDLVTLIREAASIIKQYGPTSGLDSASVKRLRDISANIAALSKHSSNQFKNLSPAQQDEIRKILFSCYESARLAKNRSMLSQAEDVKAIMHFSDTLELIGPSMNLEELLRLLLHGQRDVM